jgi:type IV pilus assembly protein PilQ
MRMRSRRIISSTVALISLALFFTGCAQRMQSVKEDSLRDANGPAALQNIKVSEDGYQVEISSSKPLTYTYYKTTAPLKVIIDISQTEPGAITAPVESNAGNVRRVEVVRHGFGQNVLSRVEIALANDSEFTITTNPENKGKLLVAFARAQSVQTGPKADAEVEAKRVKDENSPPLAPAQNKNEEMQARAGEMQAGSVDKQEKAEAKQAEPAANEAPVAAARKTMTVTAVNVVNDGVEVVVPGGVDTFNSFKLTKPSRLVLDIPGVKNGAAVKIIDIHKFGIDYARLGSSPDKVRVVFDVTGNALPPYRIEKSENGLKIVLQGGAPAEPVKTAAENDKAPVERKAQEPGRAAHKFSMVEAIDFKSVEGYSQISVKVSGACAAEKPRKSANRWAMTIKNCQLPLKLQRMLDTSAFSSAVQEVTPYQVRIKGGYETKILVKLRSDAPFNFRQEGDTVYWSIKNPEKEEKPAAFPEPANRQPAPVAVSARKGKAAAIVIRETAGDMQINAGLLTDKKKGYTGRKVTLEFSDADVRKIFQLIAEVSNLNFLISDDVSGTISLKLVNVPWDQALEVILDSKNLEMKRDGNIIQIKPKGKFKTQDQEDAEAKREREKRMELVTRVFDINFASIGDMESKFKELSSKFPGTSVISDSRTNKVIVIDNEYRIKKMEELLAKLDGPEKQVMIEARIVEASSTFTRDLGVQWGIHYKDASASILGINQLDTGFGGVVTPPPIVGFPAQNSPGGAMGLSFGTLTSNIQLDMRISAAATAGLVKIISSPKVVTLNNKAAKISQGQSIPYQTTSAEGTKTQFVDATLSLEVTPHVTADGNIGMKIMATNNSPGALPAGANAPSINMKTANTELLVKNGETTVIGGIYVDSDTESDSGVPFFMDIPLLGWMFKSNSKSKTKTELLIFITPRVVN